MIRPAGEGLITREKKVAPLLDGKIFTDGYHKRRGKSGMSPGRVAITEKPRPFIEEMRVLQAMESFTAAPSMTKV